MTPFLAVAQVMLNVATYVASKSDDQLYYKDVNHARALVKYVRIQRASAAAARRYARRNPGASSE